MSGAVYCTHAGLPGDLYIWVLFWLEISWRKGLFKGCFCILSPSIVIGLENEFVHSPGLIGIKYKYMEWHTALAVTLTGSINICRGNRIRRNCAFVQLCASIDMYMSVQVCICLL